MERIIIKTENVKRAFDTPAGKFWALKGIDLEIQEGKFVILKGRSGSGKTTLMNIMGCLDTPTSGTYLFNGENVADADEARLTRLRNRHIGFVFQSFYLLPKLTAKENVALPLLYAGVPKKERLARAESLLTELGLGERMEFLPNQLSGGQQQRVAIARAMAGDPQVLFADEPTGALDSASGEQIMALFDRIHRGGAAVVMITHEQAIADRAEKIMYIRDGILSDKKEADGFEE